jgi:hypothetical protein
LTEEADVPGTGFQQERQRLIGFQEWLLLPMLSRNWQLAAF